MTCSRALQEILPGLMYEKGKSTVDSMLKSYVKKIRELPTLPATALAILEIHEDDLLCMNKLKEIVDRDPAISARILSVANSVYFGYPVRSEKMSDALMKVGFRTARSIAVGIALLSFVDDGREAAGYRKLFDHAVSVSVTARFVAKYVGLSGVEDIVTDGLLHDLGYLALHSYFPEVYRHILSAHKRECSLLHIEKEVLGYTHADVGFWLADQWNLPASILDANLYHHAPSLAERNTDRVAVLHIADFIVGKCVSCPFEHDPHYPLDRGTFDILGVKERELLDMEQLICDGPLSAGVSGLSLQNDHA